MYLCKILFKLREKKNPKKPHTRVISPDMEDAKNSS